MKKEKIIKEEKVYTKHELKLLALEHLERFPEETEIILEFIYNLKE